MGVVRSGTSRTYGGVSVDTRMALGGGDAGSYHAERRDNAPTSPKIITSSGATHCLTAPQSVASAATVARDRGRKWTSRSRLQLRELLLLRMRRTLRAADGGPTRRRRLLSCALCMACGDVSESERGSELQIRAGTNVTVAQIYGNVSILRAGWRTWGLDLRNNIRRI